AEAIQPAARCEASPVSAVTSPPPPRLTLPSSWKVTGPRFETRPSGCWRPPSDTSGRRLGGLLGGGRRGRGLRQLAEDPQVVAQVARRQEVLAHVLLAAPAERLAQRRVAQDVQRPLGAGLAVAHEIPRDSVPHLQRDTPDMASDE